MRRRGQEELIGFGIIIVIVLVVMVIFFSIAASRGSDETYESYEQASFLHGVRQVTTSCSSGFSETNFRTVDELIGDCSQGRTCQDGRSSCEVLETMLREVLAASYAPDEDGFVRGYRLEIVENQASLLLIEEGNSTRTYKEPNQVIGGSGETASRISFRVYY